MREIERELGMETKQLIGALDKWKMPRREDEKKEQYQRLREEIIRKLTSVSEEQKQKIANCREPLPDDYEPPGTAKQLFFHNLFCPLISVWVILGLCIAWLLVRQLVG